LRIDKVFLSILRTTLLIYGHTSILDVGPIALTAAYTRNAVSIELIDMDVNTRVGNDRSASLILSNFELFNIPFIK
jgi:hypothetical protein